MIATRSKHWTRLAPPFLSSWASGQFLRHATALARYEPGGDGFARAVKEMVRRFAHSISGSRSRERPVLLASRLLLRDLRMQGWLLRVRGRRVFVQPAADLADRSAEKERIRRQELVKRDAQLARSSVRRFVQSMEQPRLFNGKHVSIFSVIRDGRDLAAALRDARKHTNNGWAEALRNVVDPYLQVVHSSEELCAHTGLKLLEIWRYFRHTWTNQHTTVPGRNMMFLVRDAAAPYHPIVGIGSLSSPIMQIGERDRWIGWHPDPFVAGLVAKPTVRMARWLSRIASNGIDEIYIGDFLEEGILTRRHLKVPTTEVVRRLLDLGAVERGSHYRYARAHEHKRKLPARSRRRYWVARARMHLFRSKRALALATYFHALLVLRRHFGDRPNAKGLQSLLAMSEGQDVVRKLLKKAKADRIGISVADISVCGAVQPYNAILGGKLTAMFAASPEIVAEYQRRYGTAESEIASSMAGRPIIRRPHLVLLGTTSLYGVGSSQYNRVKIPCSVIGGFADESLVYQELGRSEAYGTSQFSDETIEALAQLVAQAADGQRVNSIFGEGISPRLRKARAGLDALNFPSDLLLRHHRRRIVYAVSLVRNQLDYLLGLQRRPAYVYPRIAAKTSTLRIAEWWRERWLRGRIASDEVLAQVSQHTLVRPVAHGARVRLLGSAGDLGGLEVPPGDRA
jgi:hypothetical protein